MSPQWMTGIGWAAIGVGIPAVGACFNLVSHAVPSGVSDASNGSSNSSGSSDAAPRDGSASFDAGGSCTMRSFLLEAGSANQGPGACAPTRCVDSDAGLLLGYCIDREDAGDGGAWSWGTCDVAAGQSVELLDVDYGGTGIIEVTACLDAPPPAGSVNLWYGSHPVRKWLPLLIDGYWKDGQAATAGECRSLFFLPREARYPDNRWDGGEYPPATCPIRNSCGAGGAGCLDKGGLAPTLTLAGEWASKHTQGTVRLVRVRQFSSDCFCSKDPQCRSGTSCVPVPGAPLGPGFDDCRGTSTPPGVCAECDGQGKDCTVTSDAQSCNGVFVCVAGRLACSCGR